jgi:uncharacterized protein YecE (DUF72 family)
MAVRVSASDRMRVGCCGLPVGLAQYSRTFRVVEVQQTFYHPPQVKTLEKWRSTAPASFEFVLKAWQLITHEAGSPTYRRLREKLTPRDRREVGAFRLCPRVVDAWWRMLQCVSALGSRVILFQCPASFTPTSEHKENLRSFFRLVNRQPPRAKSGDRLIFVWEPRGAWRPEEVGELCEELDLVHGVDPFHQSPATRGVGYFRLHGRTGYRHRYSPEELKQLSEMASPFKRCYVLFNNLSMWEDARRFSSPRRR